MNSHEKYDPPKETKADHGHAIVRSGLGAIPYAGATAIEIFNKIIIPPIEKRRDEWRRIVGEKLREMEETGTLNLEDLTENEGFSTVILEASHIALRNHQVEKLEALKNAVINSALPNPPEESIQLMFINMVDDFTVWHLRILRLLQNPIGWFQDNNRDVPEFSITSSISQLLNIAYPELKSQREFFDLIGIELEAKKVLSGGSSFHTMMSASGAFAKRTTDFGDQFLEFITD